VILLKFQNVAFVGITVTQCDYVKHTVNSNMHLACLKCG